QIHSKSKKSVSPEKVAYCFFNFPLKFDPSELSGLTSVSAFDMIDFVTRIVYDAQSYEGQKVMSNFDGQISGPKIIYNKISSFRSKELFICKLENGNCHWNLYLPIVYSNGNWEEQQPEEVIKPDNFFIDRRLFEISRLDEMRFISKPYQGGIKWVKGKNRVYFGNMLVEHMEMVESMPKED
ncbi:hypothetical protein HYW75_01090, partial [Candidatus Pacearchaeota archaeon]|nr:hypothetical protein [Candidatus Pacearchaeota archaeon]